MHTIFKAILKIFWDLLQLFFLIKTQMFHVKQFLCNQKIKTIQRKKSHIAVRLFARGLDKEMGMSGTDAFASSGK